VRLPAGHGRAPLMLRGADDGNSVRPVTAQSVWVDAAARHERSGPRGKLLVPGGGHA